jgi:hypothetical protein
VRLLPQAQRQLVALAVVGAVLGGASSGRALAATPLSADLTVARRPGTEDCPDREALARLVERIVSPGAPGGRVRAGGQVVAA